MQDLRVCVIDFKYWDGWFVDDQENPSIMV